MNQLERDQMLQEVHQGIYGVKESDDKGLVGDLREVKDTVKELNGRVRFNTVKIASIIGVLIGLGILGGLEIADITHILGM